MQAARNFTECSIFLYHQDTHQAEKIRQLLVTHGFGTVQMMGDAALLLGKTLAEPSTFAFMGSGEWNNTLLDIALQLRKYAPQTHRILQLPIDAPHLLPLLEANANGYLCPQTAEDELVLCLAEAMVGKCYLCNSIRQLLTGVLNPIPQADAALFEKLTAREKEVMHLVASGLAAAEIADKLCLGYHTVKNHKSNIIMKLGLGSRVGLYMFAGRNKALFENTKVEK